MKVVGLVGSPRKNGNTAALIKKAMEGAEAKGAETQLFYLNELNLRGCQGCYGWQMRCKRRYELDLYGHRRSRCRNNWFTHLFWKIFGAISTCDGQDVCLS